MRQNSSSRSNPAHSEEGRGVPRKGWKQVLVRKRCLSSQSDQLDQGDQTPAILHCETCCSPKLHSGESRRQIRHKHDRSHSAAATARGFGCRSFVRKQGCQADHPDECVGVAGGRLGALHSGCELPLIDKVRFPRIFALLRRLRQRKACRFHPQCGSPDVRQVSSVE